MLKKYEESNIQAVADKIREKTGKSNTYYTSEMAAGVNEVFEAGKAEVISNSKYIPKQATGKVISLTDVSEVAHKVKVYGDNCEVDVYGKNLLPYPYYSENQTIYGLTYTDNGDGSIIINGTATGNIQFTLYSYALSNDKISLSPNTEYVLSGCKGGSGTTYDLRVSDNKTTAKVSTNGSTTFSYADVSQFTVSIYVRKDSALDNVVFRPQISFSDGEYEPYTKQTITATPTGTEIDSICPNMNFFADGELDILVEYFSSFGRAEKELAMWNALTNYGTREVYSSAFAYADYSGYTIPKGLCKPRQTIGSMFYVYQGVELPKGVDCSEFNVSTTVQSYHPYNTFAYSPKLKRIYDIGIPANVMIYGGTYRGCSALETIEIIRSAENTMFDANCFNGCSKLTHVIFSGVIASNINLQWSKLLDEESLVSLAVSLAHLIETGENPEGSNVPDGLQFTKTVTLSPESWAILENTLYPDTGLSCAEFITTVKGWLRA